MNKKSVSNQKALERLKMRKASERNTDYYVQGIRKGDIAILSQAITLVESLNSNDKIQASNLIEACLPMSGKALRVGITGVPGVGKSTFIENFGHSILAKGKKLAVLAIDPTSQKSKGSILGDKTRMETLTRKTNAYIRPSAAADTLGGVARKTRETIILCEAAGFDYILIETVGVGQSETAVHSMVDFFLLLMLSNAGDELQGIKRGIMEMADAIVITKADGDNVKKAQRAAAEYKSALHLFPASEKKWIPQVATCSALENTGLEETLEMLEQYFEASKNSGMLQYLREEQAKYWMNETLQDYLMTAFKNSHEVKNELSKIEQEVVSGKLSPFKAANKLYQLFSQSK